jgi:hypothetical protein
VSGRTDWTSSALPGPLIRAYPRDVADSMREALGTGDYCWRFTGGTHLEFRHVPSGRRVSLTTGDRASRDPVWPRKWRSYVRGCERAGGRAGPEEGRRQEAVRC